MNDVTMEEAVRVADSFIGSAPALEDALALGGGQLLQSPAAGPARTPDRCASPCAGARAEGASAVPSQNEEVLDASAALNLLRTSCENTPVRDLVAAQVSRPVRDLVAVLRAVRECAHPFPAPAPRALLLLRTLPHAPAPPDARPQRCSPHPFVPAGGGRPVPQASRFPGAKLGPRVLFGDQWRAVRG